MLAVTGGAGFIGSAVICELNRRAVNDILVIDDISVMSREKKDNLAGLKYSDLKDKDEFLNDFKSGRLEKIETIIHMGACSSTTETDRDYLQKVNYEYTKELAGYCVDNSLIFIYASSAATYGDGEEGFSDSHEELESFRPLNLYGDSKHRFDIWALKNGVLDRITGLKYFNVYGPNEYHKGDMRSFVVKAFEQIKSSGKVRLFKSYREEYPDGGQVRDFIYVKDAVMMTLHFLDNSDIRGIYNIGTGIPRTWNDLVRAVFDAMGKTPNIEYIEMPAQLKDQYQYHTAANMNKFFGTGYDRKLRSLEEGIRDYVVNYLVPGSHLEPCGCIPAIVDPKQLS
ncbi:MAG: ADP-glyceromanno-heptose 6-epimerase [Elusimicrobiota bacterium]